MKHQFIALEGVDGSGKTSVARELAQQIGGHYMKTPGEGFKPAREYIDNGTPPETKLLYYLSSVFDASAQIQGILTRQPVICDRYVWSTLIPHSAYHERSLIELEEELRPMTSKLLVPDQTILLAVDEEEQLIRLSRDRGLDISASDRFCMDTSKRRIVRNLYESIAQREGWRMIDTTGKTAEQVVEEIRMECLV